MGQNKKVAVLLRCQHRFWQLEWALANIQQLRELIGWDFQVILMPDRPSEIVADIVQEAEEKDWVHRVNIEDDYKRHRWAKTAMMGLNMGLKWLDRQKIRPKWIWFHDDDEIIGTQHSKALAKCLENNKILAWLGTSLYSWDQFNKININIFHHSPIFSRYRPGDRFPEDGQSVAVTEPVHKRIQRNMYRKKTLPFFIHDLSVMIEEERRKYIEKIRNSGKSDNYTRAFEEVPQIMDLGDIEKNYSVMDFTTFQARKRGLLVNGNGRKSAQH